MELALGRCLAFQVSIPVLPLVPLLHVNTLLIYVMLHISYGLVCIQCTSSQLRCCLESLNVWKVYYLADVLTLYKNTLLLNQIFIHSVEEQHLSLQPLPTQLKYFF